MDKFLLAAVFGPLMIVIGLVRLFCLSQQQEVNQSIKNTPAVVFMAGLINLLLGLLIVNVYNLWIWNMGIFVTLLGWMMIVRGGLLLIFPKKMVSCWIENRSVDVVLSIIGIAWGIVLTIFAHY